MSDLSTANSGGRTPSIHSECAPPGAAFEITAFKTNEGILSKELSLKSDGGLNNPPLANLYDGWAKRVVFISMTEFAHAIAELPSTQAIALGALVDGYADEGKVRVVTQRALDRLNGAASNSTITRSKKYFHYRPGQPALVLIDYDTGGMPDEVRDRIDAAGGLWGALCGMVPALAGAGYVRRASTSGGLTRTDTNEAVRGGGGQHIYIVAKDGTDAKRFLETLLDRCWLAGLGWIKVSACGTELTRGVVDAAVSGPERLVFEGAPKIIPPLVQDPVARLPVAVEGDVVDTRAACPDLTDGERARLRELRKADKARVAPEVAEKTEAYAQRIAARDRIPIERARQQVRDLRCGELAHDTVVRLHEHGRFTGTVTVAEILAEPVRYTNHAVFHPGGEDHEDQAYVRPRKNGSLVIYSHHHGNMEFKLQPAPEAPPEPAAVEPREPRPPKRATPGSGFTAIILDPDDPRTSARVFADQRARPLICHAGDIYEWRGSLYSKLNDDDVRAELYSFLEKADRKAGKVIVPFAPNTAKVNNVLDALRALVHLPSERSPPCWTGGEAITTRLLACRNGLVRLVDGATIEHSPSYFNTSAAAFDYDPAAGEPVEWLKFMASIWPEDAESIKALQEMFGYVLSGDMHHQKMFLLVGPPRCGKGTIGRILVKLLGGQGHVSLPLGSLNGDFGLQPLLGKILAIVPDARLQGRSHTIVERLLAISGEDDLTVARKNTSSITVRLPARFVFLTNVLPSLANSSGTIAKRFIIIQFTISFYGEEDKELEKRLTAELPAILNWSIAGWRRLEERGRFLQPASGERNAETLTYLASPMAQFIAETYVLDPRGEVDVDKVYMAWGTWWRASGQSGEVGSKTSFGMKLSAAFPQIKKEDRKRYGKGRVVGRWSVYVGLRLPEDQGKINQGDLELNKKDQHGANGDDECEF